MKIQPNHNSGKDTVNHWNIINFGRLQLTTEKIPSFREWSRISPIPSSDNPSLSTWFRLKDWPHRPSILPAMGSQKSKPNNRFAKHHIFLLSPLLVETDLLKPIFYDSQVESAKNQISLFGKKEVISSLLKKGAVGKGSYSTFFGKELISSLCLLERQRGVHDDDTDAGE